MSLREMINRNPALHGLKELVSPLWVAINGRTGLDKWLFIIRHEGERPVDTIFDVGASHGHFLKKAWTHFPVAKYHHFEPRPDAAAGLKQQADKLGARSQIHQLALADQADIASFAVTSYGDASSLIVPRRGASDNLAITHEIEVKVERLDTLLPHLGVDRVGLLKIDVEGVERRVLLGAPETLAKSQSVILEISPAWHVGGYAETLEVFEIMFKAGFSLVDTFSCDYLFSRDEGLRAYFNHK